MLLPKTSTRPPWGLVLATVASAAVIARVEASVASQESPNATAYVTVGTAEKADSSNTGALESVDFARDVFPILQKNCLECHGAAKQEGDLRVDQSDILLTEDFVVPGDAENSRMYEVLISEDEDRMPPPEESESLPTKEILVIKSWIDEGAKWSDISAMLIASAQANADATTDASMPLSPRAEFWRNTWRAFGDLHPATVHFPIALLVVGGLFALFGLRGSYRCSDFAFYCLWMGAISAIIASIFGWSFAWNEGHNEDPFLFEQQADLFWHRWTGVLLSILAFLVAVWATIVRRRNPDDGTLWKLCLIVLAGLTIYVGHAGGELTHRRGYRRLYELIGIQAPAKPATEQSPNSNSSAEPPAKESSVDDKS